MKFRFFIPVIVVALLAVVFWRGLFLDPTKVPSPLVGKPVPEFSLPTLHDPEARFTDARFREGPALFNVFGTWCPGCHTEHALLVEMAGTLDVPIYGLNWKDDRKAAIAWLQDDGNPYTDIAFDKDGDVAIDWGVYGAPETFVVDGDGIIRYKHIGILTRDVLQEDILPLLETLKAETQGGTP
ncbi:MAG: DsbE family thiol:disulfide interchange protein [Gammaproteobacteria bacterium]|nr:DsbE family thiol:disulfide interchange protein [Gammaproteobacteria bacterium]